jgi:hypothetical protein
MIARQGPTLGGSLCQEERNLCLGRKDGTDTCRKEFNGDSIAEDKGL